MFISLAVENLDCFRNPASLSFRNLNKTENGLSKTVGLIGKPGSGKSSFIRQWMNLKILLIGNIFTFDKSLFSPYRYDEETKNEPCRFEVEFVRIDIRYVYRIAIYEGTIIEEELLCDSLGKLTPLYSIHNGRMMFDQSRIPNEDLDYLMDHYDHDSPLLSLMESRSVPYIDQAYYQLAYDLDFENCLSHLDEEAMAKALAKPKYHCFLIQCLHSLGYSIKALIDDQGIKVIRIINGKEHRMPLSQEGSHLRRFLSISGSLYNSLSRGRLLFLDNLETMSQDEAKFILSLFESNQYNNDAQLLYAGLNPIQGMNSVRQIAKVDDIAYID